MNDTTSNDTPSDPPAAPPLDARAKRGLALALAQRDAIMPLAGSTSKFMVPSASGNGSGYVVDTQAVSCACKDWKAQGGYDRPTRCKHLWCMHFAERIASGESADDLMALMEEPKRPRKKKDPSNQKERVWKVINKGRTAIPDLGPRYLAELADGAQLPEKLAGTRGRPCKNSNRDIVLTALLREWEGTTAGGAVAAIRRFCAGGDIRMARAPNYNSLLDRFAKPELMAHMHRMLAASALPLVPFESGYSADGTALPTCVYDHYYGQKHLGQKRKQTKRAGWVAFHAAWGVDTHVIVAAQPTAPDVGEAPIMPELLRRAIATGIRQEARWYGDAAYLAEDCALACEKAGKEFFVDFSKRNVDGRTKRAALHRLWKKMDADRDEYRRQYEKGHPLCEAGNAMFKERFGHSLKSRKPSAQYAEVMLRAICHNVACLIMAILELEIDPKYWDRDAISQLPDFGSTVLPASTGAPALMEVQ